ncbi:hypothetical protein F5Y04DRAFT_282945 [Hypomontagnella monticulosa]|nr:hypothetical protein F5Y04DRAFT_282945 [Hypomontagnella monticulosa]
MAAAVQLLSDASILATYNLYCQDDPVVTITIRKAEDPSPNSSRSASYHSSLAAKQKISARRRLLVPDLFVQPTVRHVSGSTDISTMEPIEDESTMVTLLSEGELYTKEYLLGWIDSQVSDSKCLTEIQVQQLNADGTIKHIQLTSMVWQKSLIRGQWKKIFGPIWDDYVRCLCEREVKLDRLSESVPGFRQSCHNFIHDLRTYGSNKGSQSRLDETGHEFYMGPPYFDDDTRQKLLSLPAMKAATLETLLKSIALKRKDTTICASHDLAPIFEAILGIKWDKYSAKAFTEARKSSGGIGFHEARGKAKELVKKGSMFLKNTIGRGGSRT